MTYLEIRFSPLNSEEEQSLLTAELLDKGFESFVEEGNTLLAYIPIEIYREEMLKDLFFLQEHPEVKTRVRQLEDINWNKEWESNYRAVTIDGKCYVRAPFHPPLPDITYEIVIEPKMAFGTAHHETTQLMAGWLMEMDVKEKEILDMGCGTGILAILANKMGAKNVTGIDNDEWAWRNCLENFRINNVDTGSVLFGDAALIRPDSYDMILANINRNILIRDMKAYSDGLRKNGILLLCGFYQKDVDAVTTSASACDLHENGSRIMNDWSVLLFYK